MEGAPIQYDASIWDAQRPCQLPSTSPIATSPSSKGHGVYSAHKTTRPIHVVKFFPSVVLIAVLIIFVISMQVTQQVYVAEDLVQNAHNKFDPEAQSRHEVEKALDTANHEKTQLVEKLKVAENARQSAEVGLKTAEA